MVRKYYTSKFRKGSIDHSTKNNTEITLLTIIGVTMILPLINLFSDWLDFANYPLPYYLSLIGVILFPIAIILLWRSHHDLGNNWTVTLKIKDEQTLVTSGIYKHIRHPMYSAHLFWAIAQILLIHNWIAGPAFLIFFIGEYLYRVKKEEEMMIKKFGSEYKEYMNKTGRLLPKPF